MSEYAKNIQTIEDLWKKRIELREGGGRMSDKNPCPFCGDESEYLRFLDLCAERANEIWRENEVRIMTDVYKSMGFVQVVRCRDCTNKQPYDEPMGCDCLCGLFWIEVEPDGFCAWGERREE